jgi:hypothetical protein
MFRSAKIGAIKSNKERHIMNKNRFLTFVLLIGTLLLSACGAAASPATPAASTSGGASKGEAMPVSFVGIVDSIAGDQWVISGTTVTVDPSIVRDGPFNVGDTIKVEGFVKADGSLTVSRVETPSPQDAVTATPFGDDNSNDANANDNANVNDGNINDDNGNDVNSNDDNGNDGNINDYHGAKSNDDNSNTVNSNDDNGGGSNSNDDKGGGSNSNDDHGGSGGGGGSNDDNGNGG